MDETRKLLVDASNFGYPLSVVLVGVAPKGVNVRNLNILDGDSRQLTYRNQRARRDIVQFVGKPPYFYRSISPYGGSSSSLVALSIKKCKNMDDFICNPGLAFLASHIFDQLDIGSLVRCRMVCRNWRQFIDCQKFTWVKILQSVTGTAEMKKWLRDHKVYHDFVKAAAETKKYREDTKKLATLFSKFKPACHLSPLHQSVSRNDWESVMFLMNRLDLNPMKALEEDPHANTPAHLCAKDTDAVKYF